MKVAKELSLCLTEKDLQLQTVNGHSQRFGGNGSPVRMNTGIIKDYDIFFLPEVIIMQRHLMEPYITSYVICENRG